MKNILATALLLIGLQAFGQQITLKDVFAIYDLRGDSMAILKIVKDSGFVFVGQPYEENHDCFIHKSAETMVAMQWGKRVVYNFKSLSLYQSYEIGLAQMGYTNTGQLLIEKDMVYQYKNGNREAYLVKFNLGDPKQSYGISLAD